MGVNVMANDPWLCVKFYKKMVGFFHRSSRMQKVNWNV